MNRIQKYTADEQAQLSSVGVTTFRREDRYHRRHIVDRSGEASEQNAFKRLILEEVRVVNELQGVARLKIHDGKLDEFKRLAAKCTELVRTKDTGTLQYEWYFNGNNTECLVFERYRDSHALLEHHKNLGDTMTALFRTCSGSGEICGTPSPELIEQLKDSPVQVYKPFQPD
jgi:quinol monooxygenase YgiN